MALALSLLDSQLQLFKETFVAVKRLLLTFFWKQREAEGSRGGQKGAEGSRGKQREAEGSRRKQRAEGSRGKQRGAEGSGG